jgi:hypothetical protein
MIIYDESGLYINTVLDIRCIYDTLLDDCTIKEAQQFAKMMNFKCTNYNVEYDTRSYNKLSKEKKACVDQKWKCAVYSYGIRGWRDFESDVFILDVKPLIGQWKRSCVVYFIYCDDFIKSKYIVYNKLISCYQLKKWSTPKLKDKYDPELMETFFKLMTL